MFHQGIHDVVSTVAPVIDVAKDMQMIDREAGDQLRQSCNKLVRPVNPDDRIDNRLIVCLLVGDIIPLRDQFFNHVGKVRGKHLMNLAPCILARGILADSDQAVQHDAVPLLHLLLRLILPFQLYFFLRVINQGGQLPDIGF